MIKNILLLFFIGIHIQSIAQDAYDRSYMNSSNVMERISHIGPTSNVILGVPFPVPRVRGNTMLNERFALTFFDLKNREMASGQYAKYDLFKDEFYIISNTGYNVLRGSEVNGST